VAGAYSEDLPFLIISGGPNTNDQPENHIIHHTICDKDLTQQSQCFKPIVSKVFVIKSKLEAASIIDEAIFHCLTVRKPVYLEIPCNLCITKVYEPTPICNFNNVFHHISDAISLDTAEHEVLSHIKASNKPVLIGGVYIRKAVAAEEFLHFANALGFRLYIVYNHY
jgi:TPP-dependent 2-oxoacid decarboxylase